MRSGSGQYLKGYLEVCRDAGLSTDLVFAPRRSFGNVAWARLHPEIRSLVERVEWGGSLCLGGVYVSTSPIVWGRFLWRAVEELGRRLGGRRHAAYPSLLGVELDPREARQVTSSAKALEPAVVTAEYSSLAPVLSEFPKATRIVFLHDLFSLRAEDFQSHGMEPDHVVLSLQEEAERCRAADLLVHASSVELDRMREVLPQASHVWMRPKVYLQSSGTPSKRKPHAVFIGSMHAGNAVALSYLRTEVWPVVRKLVPGTELHIVGTIAATIDPADADHEGLKLVGVLDDLAVIAGLDSVGLAPMQLGSGIPIKVVDYLAAGMTVAVTLGAIDAFGASLEGLVAEAETEQEYPVLIAQLLTNQSLRQETQTETEVLERRLENTELLQILSSEREDLAGSSHQDA